MPTWESRFLVNQPSSVAWHFQSDNQKWREEANCIDDDKFYKEEENHFYKNENCPSGACIFASASKPIFNNGDSVDKHNANVSWMFHFGDNEFRRRALSAPSCIHVKELEFHEFHKKEGPYDLLNIGKPPPILPSIDCTITDPCETCRPPCHLVPPCTPCLPPPPPPSCCVPYPNALGEKEWHTVRKCSASQSESADENESCLYKRDVKTCDPCALPQIWNGRQYALPSASMRPGEMDKYSVAEPPDAGSLAPKFNYNEDEGECNKRETRGPGVYPYPGFLPSAPLSQPGRVPCGYHFNEEQAHVHCARFGGPPDPAEIKPYPDPPPCEPKTDCTQAGNNPFIEPTCGTRGPGGPCVPCGLSYPTSLPPCGPSYPTSLPPCGPSYPTSLSPYGPCCPCGPYNPYSPFCGPCDPSCGPYNFCPYPC